MAATAALSGSITDLGLDIATTYLSRVTLVVEANTPGSLLRDTTGNTLLAGAKRVQVDRTTGTFSQTLVTTDSTGIVPADDRLYRATLIYPSGVPGAKNVTVSSGWFEFTASASLADVWQGIEVTAVSSAVYASITGLVAELEDIRVESAANLADQVDISNISTSDAVVAGLVANTGGVGPLTSGALSASFVQPAAKTKVGPIASLSYLNALDFDGIYNDGVTTCDLTDLKAALAAGIGSPVCVYFPPGLYIMAEPLPSQDFITYYGVGFGGSATGATLRWVAGSMIVPGGRIIQNVVFDSLGLQAYDAADHMIDVGTDVANGLIHWRFSRCNILLNVADASFMHQGAGPNNTFDIDFDSQCQIGRSTAHTVPAFDLIGGVGLNNFRFRGGQWRSDGCTSTPFFRAASTAGGWVGPFYYDDVIGEQNAGGMIEIASPWGARINGCIDYDQGALGAYQADLFKLSMGAGIAPTGCSVIASGTDSAATFAATKKHVNISAGPRNSVERILNGASGTPTVLAPGAQQSGLIGVKVGLSTDQSVASGLAVDYVDWTSEVWDTDGFHAANSNILQVPTGQEGYYLVTATISYSAPAATSTRNIVRLVVNDTTVVAAEEMGGDGTAYLTMNLSTETYLAAGDYIGARLQNTGALSLSAGLCSMTLRKVAT